MVSALSRAVISRVRPARTNQASSVPTNVLPTTIHIVWMPKPQPSRPG